MSENQDELSEDLSRIPDDLIAALLDMLAGHRSFSDFRDELANTLYNDSSLAGPVERWVATRGGPQAIPSHLQRLLINDVQRICTEDVPTLIDTSFSAPAEKSLPEVRSQVSLVHSVDVPTGELTEPGKASTSVPEKEKPQADLEQARGESDSDVIDLDDEDSETTQVVTRGMVLCDRYELLERVSGGNMSLVFKARDTKQGKEDALVAIKILDPVMARNGRVLRALLDEYEKGRSYDHPNIVRYLGLEYHGSDIFLVLEWLEGQTLAEILNRSPGHPYDSKAALQILRELASALQLIHDSGFVHGDVKPGNIMLMSDGHIKLLDFGVSRAFGEKRKTRIGFDASVLGAMTPAYASAGLLDGDELTPADDVYAYSALGVRMFSGSRVYGRVNALQARDSGLAPQLFDIRNAEARELIERGVSHDTRDRPALADILQAFDLQIDEPESLNPFSGMRSRQIIVLSMLLGVLLVGGLVWQQLGPDRLVIEEGQPERDVSLEEASTTPKESSKAHPPVIEPEAEETPLGDGIAEVSVDPKAQASSTQLRWDATTNEPELLQLSGEQQNQSIELYWPASLGVDSARVDLIAVDEPTSAPRLSMTPTGTVSLNNNALVVSLDVEADHSLSNHQRYRIQVRPQSRSEDVVDTFIADVLVPNLPLRELGLNYPGGAFTFESATLAFEEASGLVSLRLFRVGPLDQSARAEIRVVSETAHESEDYFKPLRSDLVFEPGQSAGTILIPLLSDQVMEPTESFLVMLPGQQAGRSLITQVRVSILDLGPSGNVESPTSR